MASTSRGAESCEQDLVLAQSEERLRTIVAEAPIPIMVHSLDGEILAVNRAFTELTGYRLADVRRGADWSRHAFGVSASEAEEHHRAFLDWHLESPDGELEQRIRTRDGRERVWIVRSTRPQHLADGRTLLATIAVDVTDRRRSEAALRAARDQLRHQEKLVMIGTLAGAVSHELRNPLGAIKNAAYLLRNLVPPSPDTEEALAILDVEVDRAERIISSLLDYMWPRPAERCRTPISKVIDEALGLCVVPAGVSVDIEGDMSLELDADPRQVVQVLCNLVTNAIQAMVGRGRMLIGVRAVRRGVELIVSDTGPGIEARFLNRLFEPLFTTKPCGLGLGLTIARELVERNGGTIEVGSEPGYGASFTVTLPAARRAPRGMR